ncbi:hypothetical protein AAE478_007375 [Parahypoxylon ruwenzoriense]
MGRYTDAVDKQFEQRMNDLDLRAQATGDRIDSLSPQLDQLKDGLKSVHDLFLAQLIRSFKETLDSAELTAQNAANLQRTLEVMLNNVREGQTEIASVFEQSLQLANQRAESAMGTVMEAIAAVVEHAATLHSQIVCLIIGIL